MAPLLGVAQLIKHVGAKTQQYRASTYISLVGWDRFRAGASFAA